MLLNNKSMLTKLCVALGSETQKEVYLFLDKALATKDVVRKALIQKKCNRLTIENAHQKVVI